MRCWLKLGFILIIFCRFVFLFLYIKITIERLKNMPEAIVITPVKNSLDTTKLTVEALMKTNADIEYYVYNDFSESETKKYLDKAKDKLGFQVVHLEDITSTPSPNYKLVLEIAQEMAISKNCPLIIVESDVIVKPDTIANMLQVAKDKSDAGMVAAITVDREGNYNFPYLYEKVKSNETVVAKQSISFCCTLITNNYLNKFDFKTLNEKKDWYDVHITKQSRKLGFKNYLMKGTRVLHLPHSSRPWKNLKYTNPVLYYLKKIFLRRDKI